MNQKHTDMLGLIVGSYTYEQQREIMDGDRYD